MSFQGRFVLIHWLVLFENDGDTVGGGSGGGGGQLTVPQCIPTLRLDLMSSWTRTASSGEQWIGDMNLFKEINENLPVNYQGTNEN
jgi:hypothetical protein